MISKVKRPLIRDTVSKPYYVLLASSYPFNVTSLFTRLSPNEMMEHIPQGSFLCWFSFKFSVLYICWCRFLFVLISGWWDIQRSNYRLKLRVTLNKTQHICESFMNLPLQGTGRRNIGCFENNRTEFWKLKLGWVFNHTPALRMQRQCEFSIKILMLYNH